MQHIWYSPNMSLDNMFYKLDYYQHQSEINKIIYQAIISVSYTSISSSCCCNWDKNISWITLCWYYDIIAEITKSNIHSTNYTCGDSIIWWRVISKLIIFRKNTHFNKLYKLVLKLLHYLRIWHIHLYLWNS